MIVPMMKYSFVLYHGEYEEFLEKLQEIGMVDVTVSGWEADESQREMILKIENLRKAAADLSKRNPDDDRPKTEAFADPDIALANYLSATEEIARLNAEEVRLRKEIEDIRPWGDFSAGEIKNLENDGVYLHFFTASKKEFDASVEKWREEFVVEEIAVERGVSYFVVVTRDSSHVAIDALEVKTPDATVEDKQQAIENVNEEILVQEAVLDRSAKSVDDFRKMEAELQDSLKLSKISSTAPREAEGSLVVMEGWATEETQTAVDEFLATSPVVFVKDNPQAEDEPPVLLKNNRFARLFEVIGGFYDLPKYGTMDLTPYYAPFYMLFFGFCLADAGYGLLYVLLSLIALFKVPEKYKGFAKLVMLCGISTIFFGLITGNFFGMALGDQPLFKPVSQYILTSDQLFPLAIAVGLVHILFGTTLKVIFTIKTSGFRYAASTLGWMIVILSGLAVFLLPNFGIDSYTLSSVPFWIVTGVGLFMMLFMNSPGKNPFVNFGLGLWNTYNDITGLLSDVLSYIRLFALGLSGGILALVFNKLAMEMSPDIVVVKQVVMILILAVGQGLTIFMSSLSAFVHPLRLTFVEFYKNAGFEGGGRAFNPLKKEKKEN